MNKLIKIPAWARRGDELAPGSLATRPRQVLLRFNTMTVGHRRTCIGAGVQGTEGHAAGIRAASSAARQRPGAASGASRQVFARGLARADAGHETHPLAHR